MDIFEQEILSIKDEIHKFLNDIDSIPQYMSQKQLIMTIDELEKMNQVRNPSKFMPYFPKGICDCWDDNDELGNRLMKILDVYVKL